MPGRDGANDKDVFAKAPPVLRSAHCFLPTELICKYLAKFFWKIPDVLGGFT